MTYVSSRGQQYITDKMSIAASCSHPTWNAFLVLLPKFAPYLPLLRHFYVYDKILISYPTIRSFNKYLLSDYYIPGTVLGSEQNTCKCLPSGTYLLVRLALVSTALLRSSTLVPSPGGWPRDGAPKDQHQITSPGSPLPTRPCPDTMLPNPPIIFHSQTFVLAVPQP